MWGAAPERTRRRDKIVGQFLADYNWLTWVVIGLLAGAIAKAIMPGRDPGGCLVTIVIGIAGALLAGFLGQSLGWYERGEGAGFLAAIVGAILILFVYRLINRGRY
jgi:uncharacterized membrane protein YeaQ/YmgE (transglycosylase-associated protein family)